MQPNMLYGVYFSFVITGFIWGWSLGLILTANVAPRVLLNFTPKGSKLFPKVTWSLLDIARIYVFWPKIFGGRL